MRQEKCNDIYGNMERIKTLPKNELLSLAITKNKIDLAQSKLDTAQSQLDLSIMNFKYHLLSIFNELGIPSDCKIADDGTIIYPDEPINTNNNND